MAVRYDGPESVAKGETPPKIAGVEWVVFDMTFEQYPRVGPLNTLVRPGDWIVRDPKGSFSAYTPAQFEATYEPV
jgi:hypothetical protein